MKSLVLSAILLMSVASNAQTVHIASDCSCIEIKSDTYFDDVFSSIVFTVSWPSNMTAPKWKPSEVIPAYSAGPSVISNGRTYQTFSGIGFVALKDMDYALTPDAFVCIMKFEGAPVRVEEKSSAFNSDFYVSLNGKNSTGHVDSNPCRKTTKIGVYPNPVAHTLTISVLEGNFSLVRLVNANGQLVYSNQVTQEQFYINITNLPSGKYSLILLGKDQHRQKIIIDR